jgi:hypothetical protein
MDKQLIAATLAVGAVLGGFAVSSLTDANAGKRVVSLEVVDAASLAADYLELRKLPDAGVQAFCRGNVNVEGGGTKALEPSTFEADGKEQDLMLNALSACDDHLKETNPKLK